jgi:hypothetical protein
MYVVQMRHKLTRPEEDKEDLLTGNVFGLWRYLPINCGLKEFLGTATNLNGEKLRISSDDGLEQMEFWPWVQEGDAKGAQPDVLMEFSSSSTGTLVMVESKYLSGKSSEADEDAQRPNDQLAREMHNLRRLAARKGIDAYFMLYVTADTSMPREDFIEAAEELSRKTSSSEAQHFFWTTWRHVPGILAEAADRCGRPGSMMLNDLRTILEDMGLVFFRGIVLPVWVTWERPYVFTLPETAFSWGVTSSSAPYVFASRETDFSWKPIRSFESEYRFADRRQLEDDSTEQWRSGQ